jgi:hypothetical protein
LYLPANRTKIVQQLLPSAIQKRKILVRQPFSLEDDQKNCRRIGRSRKRKISVPQFKNLLEKKSKEPSAWTAPPSGLFLEKVLYRDDNAPTKFESAFPVR